MSFNDGKIRLLYNEMCLIIINEISVDESDDWDGSIRVDYDVETREETPVPPRNILDEFVQTFITEAIKRKIDE